MIQSLWAKARLVYPEPTWHDGISRWKFCARVLTRPRLTAQWFAFLQRPGLGALMARHPYILSKLQRPYLHRRLTVRQRLEWLKGHYEFLLQRLSHLETERLFDGPGWELAALPGLNLKPFRLRLFYPLHSKEGELKLALVNAGDGAPIMALSFSFVRLKEAGQWGMFIGGMQGGRSPRQKEMIIFLTRSLHGLRPKALLVFVAQQLACLWGLSRIEAVSQCEHIYRHYCKRRSFRVNYDEFWVECNGELQRDGNYQLPLSPVIRPLHELPRNKRPIYRKRYQWLECLSREIEAGLSAYKRAGDPVALSHWAISGLSIQGVIQGGAH